jgi:galactose mutarotase-like enzyme
MDRHTLDNGQISASVKRLGAELCSLRDTSGHEFLWQAGAAWPRHAPNLFPIVGRLAEDRLTVDGRGYRMTQHGFARDREFGWIERDPEFCRLRLEDDAATRAMYPFAFRLDLAYRLREATLEISFELTNTGTRELPASLGAHPAFRWPLADGVAKEVHILEFSVPESSPIRGLRNGLLDPISHPTPIQGNRLELNEGLFAADALILDRAASRSVRFSAPGAPAVTVGWEGFRELGIWMKLAPIFSASNPGTGWRARSAGRASSATSRASCCWRRARFGRSGFRFASTERQSSSSSTKSSRFEPADGSVISIRRRHVTRFSPSIVRPDDAPMAGAAAMRLGAGSGPIGGSPVAIVEAEPLRCGAMIRVLEAVLGAQAETLAPRTLSAAAQLTGL